MDVTPTPGIAAAWSAGKTAPDTPPAPPEPPSRDEARAAAEEEGRRASPPPPEGQGRRVDIRV